MVKLVVHDKTLEKYVDLVGAAVMPFGFALPLVTGLMAVGVPLVGALIVGTAVGAMVVMALVIPH